MLVRFIFGMFVKKKAEQLQLLGDAFYWDTTTGRHVPRPPPNDTHDDGRLSDLPSLRVTD